MVGNNTLGTIKNSYATGDVTADGSGAYVGGLIGENIGGTIKNNYATGRVSTNETGAYSGGLVGISRGTIENCYTTGRVTAVSSMEIYIPSIGRISTYGVGRDDNVIGGSTPEQGSGGAGGFIGKLSGTQTIKNSVYNNSTTNSVGSGTATQTNCAALSLDDMQNEEVMAAYGFTEANGWYFENGTPKLTSMLPPPPAEPSGEEASGDDSSGYDGPFSIHVGANADADTNSILLDTAVGFELNIDLTSIDGCLQAISDIDEVMTLVNDKIAELGSVYSRIESVQSTLDTTIINLTSAHSTIMDADIAEESASYIKSQILQQVTSTVLLQANSISNIALMLVE